MKALSLIVLSVLMTSCSLSLYRPTDVRPSPAEAVVILTRSVPQFVYVAPPAPGGLEVIRSFGRPAYTPPTPFRQDDAPQYVDPRLAYGYGYRGPYEHYRRYGYVTLARPERRDDAHPSRRADQTTERSTPPSTATPPAANVVGTTMQGVGHRALPPAARLK